MSETRLEKLPKTSNEKSSYQKFRESLIESEKEWKSIAIDDPDAQPRRPGDPLNPLTPELAEKRKWEEENQEAAIQFNNYLKEKRK